MMNQLRLAGSALKSFLTDSKAVKSIAGQVAREATLGTAVQQIAPRLMGLAPSQGIAENIGTNVLQSLAGAPIEYGMKAAGIPSFIAKPTSSMLGTAGIYHAQQALGNQRQQQFIDPEPHQAGNPSLDQYRQLQAMQMEEENQRYKNQIALAYAKNYSFPTRIVHTNPSADLATIQSAMNQKVNY